MDPITLGAGAIVASGVMQYYNAEKQRGATKEQLKNIKAMFDKIVPPDYNIQVWDDPSLVQNIPAPEFNTQALTPQDYKVVSQYSPEVAQFVKENAPQMVDNSSQGKAGLQAQMDALDRYRQIAAGGGKDPEFALAMQQASDRARQDAQGRIASTLESANRRGQLNSGVAMAAQLQGGSDAMQRSALMSQQAAAEAYRNKLNALSSSAQLGGQINQQQFGQQAANTDIINQFNQRTSQQYQNYLTQKAAAQNQAQIFNNEQGQRVADANVANRNQYAQYNQQYGNQMAQQNFANQNQNRQNQIDVAKYKDYLKSQQFQNEMAKTSGQAGIGMQGIGFQNQATAEQNQAIQGLGNGAMQYGMYKSYLDSRYPENKPVTPEAMQTTDRGTAQTDEDYSNYA